MDPKRLAELRDNPSLGNAEDIGNLIKMVEQSHMDGLSEAADILSASAKRGVLIVDRQTQTRRSLNAKILENAANNIRNYCEELRKGFVKV